MADIVDVTERFDNAGTSSDGRAFVCVPIHSDIAHEEQDKAYVDLFFDQNILKLRAGGREDDQGGHRDERRRVQRDASRLRRRHRPRSVRVHN